MEGKGSFQKLFNFEKNMFQYPDWKKALIEARRAFIAGVIAEIPLLWANTEVIDKLLSDVHIAFTCLVPYVHECLLGASLWTDSWVLLVIPVIAAGLAGLMKYLREKVGNGDYDHPIYKV